MPKTQHINGVRVVQKFVNDAVGTVNNLANRRITKLGNSSTYFWKIADGKGLVDEFVAEAAGACGTVVGDEGNYLPQILL